MQALECVHSSRGLEAGVLERLYRDLGRLVTIAASIFLHMAEPCIS